MKTKCLVCLGHLPTLMLRTKMSRFQSTVTGPLFKHQANLPKLPVPTLEETCAKYLQTVRPLVSDAEYQTTVRAVQDFQKPGGFGHVLQKRLESRAAKTDKSWLIEWWNDYAYMAYRDPVVINVNYFFGILY